MRKGKASQTLCSFVTLLFHDKNKSNYQFTSIGTPFLLSAGTTLTPAFQQLLITVFSQLWLYTEIIYKV